MKPLISLIIPCYNEFQALPYLYEELVKVANQMNKLDFEFLFIDDGSKDNTLQLIKELAKNDNRVLYISFSRNFGKESAMFAGLSNAKGDYVAIMDADMQDPPSLLPQMYDAIINEGFDCVATRRVTRKGEPKIRSFFARMFYRIINKISDSDIVDGARDFRLMKRKVVDSILQICERNRFTKGIFGWVGFKTKWLPYENTERVAGETKWSFWKLFKYSIDGIVNFSTAPLQISSVMGIVFCFIAFAATCFIFVRRLLFGDPVAGWASLACIVMFVSGIQLFCIGLLGQYLARTYIETKNRPIYIAAETNLDKNEKTSETKE